MLLNSKSDVFCEANVTASSRILENIDAKSCAHWRELVAGAGFEPAIRPPPDYEPRRCKPVIE